MKSLVAASLAVIALIWCQPVRAGDDAAKALEGAWVAKSMEINGKALPADVAKTMRWTFQKDKVLIRGNFEDDREEACSYRLDPKQKPGHFEFTPPNAKAPIVGIYELKDGALKICLRRESSTDKGRPTEFATQPESGTILLVFERAKKK